MKKRGRIVLFLLVLLLLVTGAVVFWIGPAIMIGERRTSFPQEFYNAYSPTHLGLDAKKVSVKSFDELDLSGWVTRSEVSQPSEGTFIFLHGVGAVKEIMLNSALWAVGNGFNAACFDSRAHGESGGEYVTYGAHEARDVSSIISFLESEGFEAPFYIWGVSMGGGVGLVAAAQDQRIRGAIIESTFCDFSEVANDYFARMVGFRFPLLIEAILIRSEKMARFDREAVKPEESCREIEVPVLLIHGDMDAHIDVNRALRNFQALKTQDKELLIVNGADHNNVWQTDPEKVNATVKNFVAQNFYKANGNGRP